jgi:hypothetical protein
MLSLHHGCFGSPSPNSINAGVFNEEIVTLQLSECDRVALIYDDEFNFQNRLEICGSSFLTPFKKFENRIYMDGLISSSPPILHTNPEIESDETIQANKYILGIDQEDGAPSLPFYIKDPQGTSSDYSEFTGYNAPSSPSGWKRYFSFIDSEDHLVSHFNFYGNHTAYNTDYFNAQPGQYGYVRVSVDLQSGEYSYTPVVSDSGNVVNLEVRKPSALPEVYRSGWVQGHGAQISPMGSWQTQAGDSLYHLFLAKENEGGQQIWSTPIMSFNNTGVDNPEENAPGVRTVSNGLIENDNAIFLSQSFRGTAYFDDSLLTRGFFGEDDLTSNIYNYNSIDSTVFDSTIFTSPNNLLAHYSHNIFKLSSDGAHLSWLQLGGTNKVLYDSFLSFSQLKNNGYIYEVGQKIAWTFDYSSQSDTTLRFVKRNVNGWADTTAINLPAGKGAYIIWLNEQLSIIDQWNIPYNIPGEIENDQVMSIKHISSFGSDTILIQGEIHGGGGLSTSLDPFGQSPAQTFEGHAVFMAFYAAPDILSSSTQTESSKAFKIYPNPASNKITIRTFTPNRAQYAIYDLAGRQVLYGTIKPYNISNVVDISGLASGTYIVQMVDNEVSYSQKIVLK